MLGCFADSSGGVLNLDTACERLEKLRDSTRYIAAEDGLRSQVTGCTKHILDVNKGVGPTGREIASWGEIDRAALSAAADCFTWSASSRAATSPDDASACESFRGVEAIQQLFAAADKKCNEGQAAMKAAFPSLVHIKALRAFNYVLTESQSQRVPTFIQLIGATGGAEQHGTNKKAVEDKPADSIVATSRAGDGGVVAKGAATNASSRFPKEAVAAAKEADVAEEQRNTRKQRLAAFMRQKSLNR